MYKHDLSIFCWSKLLTTNLARGVFISIDYIVLFSGPEEFIGPIGKLLSEDLWELPVGDFENIAAPDFPVVSEEVYNSFSNDVKYLYRVCLAAISGNYSTTWHGLAI